MSHDDNKLSIDTKPYRKGSPLVICGARINGDPAFHIEKIDPSISRDRLAFIEACLNKRPGLDRDQLQEGMDFVAAGCCFNEEELDVEKQNQAQRVIGLTTGTDLFHCGKQAYATIQKREADGTAHPETYPVKSDDFKEWLGANYLNRFKLPATSSAINDAVTALAGVATYQRPEKKVAVRMAEHGGAIYLDLADDAWRTVRITDQGWTIVEDSPIRFLRKRGMKALPTPVKGGSFARLRELFNTGDRDWMLMQAWLLGGFHPTGPYTILGINGEQGSAKSTAAKMLRGLIDPNETPLRAPPRDERDLMIQAINGWVCGFDNVSGFPLWLADALSRLSTGGGFSTRKLHSDDVEFLFNAKRPIIFNGIEEDPDRHDLMDRTIPVRLERITEEKRLPEKEVLAQYELAAPEALGALLDGVSCALRNFERLPNQNWPRMADFAKWCVAASPAMGWDPDEFLEICRNIRGDTNLAAVERSLLARALVAMLDAQRRWVGTTADLLESLDNCTEERLKRRKGWPDSVAKVSAQLRRIAPVLRECGYNVKWPDATARPRNLILEKTETLQKTVGTVGSAPSDAQAMNGGGLSADSLSGQRLSETVGDCRNQTEEFDDLPF